MKESWHTFLKISVKVLIALVILAVVAVYAGVNDALHYRTESANFSGLSRRYKKGPLDFFETWLLEK